MADNEAYDKLIGLLDEHGARYRVIDHEPEGRTEIVSRMRGNDVARAAKCVVVMVKVDRKTRRHALAVVPGDARVDLDAVKRLYGGRYGRRRGGQRQIAIRGGQPHRALAARHRALDRKPGERAVQPPHVRQVAVAAEREREQTERGGTRAVMAGRLGELRSRRGGVRVEQRDEPVDRRGQPLARGRGVAERIGLVNEPIRHCVPL